MPEPSTFRTIASLSGASAVALGAFGAHGLKTRTPAVDAAGLANWRTAASYHLIHSAVLLIASSTTALPATSFAPSASSTGVVSTRNSVACSLFTAGISLFSGSIYCLVLDGARFRFMGPVTPVGGLCLIGGWVALALGK